MRTFGALLALALAGCGIGWQQVPVHIDPSSVANPAAEIKTLLNLAENPPAQIEITDQYLKGIWVYGDGAATLVLMYSRLGEVKVLTRGDTYQVSVYDKKGEELWYWRPSTRDLESCERMVNALYALAKKSPPATVTTRR